MRRRSLPLLLLASLALGAGCTVKGSGKSATPAWKTFVHEHAMTSAPFTMRSGTAEVRVHAVVVRESRTVLGRSSSWVTVLKASVVNRGAAPLRSDDLADGFRVRTRSGEDTRGSVFTEGRDGWRHQVHTGEPTHLPAGASGEIRVHAEPNDGSTRDDPVAVSFRGQVVELR